MEDVPCAVARPKADARFDPSQRTRAQQTYRARLAERVAAGQSTWMNK